MAYTINVNNNSNTNQHLNMTEDLGNGFRLIKDSAARHNGHDMLTKSIVVGNSGVGKSSLLQRFTDDSFTPTFISTIGVDFKTVVFDRQGKIVKLQIWDTAGQERFWSITSSFFRGIHACLLVFSLDDSDSFEDISGWAKRARQHGSDDIKFVLIGNKLDLVQRNPGLRQVPTEAGQNLAQSLDAEYIETSAKDDHNVGCAFAKLAENALQRKLIGQDIAHPNNLRNPNKRIQLNQTPNNKAGGDNKPLCAGRCG